MTVIDAPIRPVADPIRSGERFARDPGPRLTARHLSLTIDDRVLLHPVDLTVAAGEIVAIAGGSGAGKTTLLRSLAGTGPRTSGEVRVDGVEIDSPRRHAIGMVPQDDILHLDLPLRRTLELAAELRMPGDADPAERSRTVDEVLRTLDLEHRAAVSVRSLSGGQRKRASIAVELLTHPAVLFLDEPTSGLDPGAARRLLAHLRSLAETGASIVITTHAPSDLRRCDRVVFLEPGGRVGYVGAPDAAPNHFGVDLIDDVYAVLAGDTTDAGPSPRPVDPRSQAAAQGRRDPIGRLRQWRAMTRRSWEEQRASALTVAILLGSPVAVIAMLVVLVPGGAFTAGPGGGQSAVQALFWVTFSSFFFGVTYGLLQIVGEFAILRREHATGVDLAAYVAAKLTVLVPLLAAVNVAMVVALQGFDRLPGTSIGTWLELVGAGTLVSIVGVALGLAASAAVHNPAQATLALPMICFPQVLFAGAAIPVSDMTPVGRGLSTLMANRWGFEVAGRTLEVSDRFSADELGGFSATFTGSTGGGLVGLGIMTVVGIGTTHRILSRRLNRR